MSFHSVACLIPMVKIQELCQSYTSMTEDKWTAWQREWAVMAVNYVQSHWSYWLISQNLRTFSCLQRTWLGQLAVSLSPAEPRICRFCMCGSLNSACIWLIDEICRRVVPTLKFSAELSNRLPPIGDLRTCIQADCEQAEVDGEDIVKLLPLLLVNSNVKQAVDFAVRHDARWGGPQQGKPFFMKFRLSVLLKAMSPREPTLFGHLSIPEPSLSCSRNLWEQVHEDISSWTLPADILHTAYISNLAT